MFSTLFGVQGISQLPWYIHHPAQSAQAVLHRNGRSVYRSTKSSPYDSKPEESAACTFFESKMLNEEATSYETNLLNIMFFNIAMKGLAT